MKPVWVLVAVRSLFSVIIWHMYILNTYRASFLQVGTLKRSPIKTTQDNCILTMANVTQTSFYMHIVMSHFKYFLKELFLIAIHFLTLHGGRQWNCRSPV